jgi:hypothetical protein
LAYRKVDTAGHKRILITVYKKVHAYVPVVLNRSRRKLSVANVCRFPPPNPFPL